MSPYDTSRVLRAVAREHLPDDTNLLPGILARIEKGHRSTMTPRSKFAIAIVIAVLAVLAGLFSVPAIATALKHLLGYIPGVGLVDPSAPIRVLAGPVRLTREGITLTVNRATLAADRTVIDYEVTGVPASAYHTTEASEEACFELPYLRLPD